MFPWQRVADKWGCDMLRDLSDKLGEREGSVVVAERGGEPVALILQKSANIRFAAPGDGLYISLPLFNNLARIAGLHTPELPIVQVWQLTDGMYYYRTPDEWRISLEWEKHLEALDPVICVSWNHVKPLRA